MTEGPQPHLADISDAALWTATAATLRTVVLPNLTDAWARTMAVQLIGLADHAARRGDDPGAARLAAVHDALAALSGNALVAAVGSSDPMVVAAGALVAAVGVEGDEADQVRSTLRPLLVAQLDDDLESTMPLLDAFRGRLPGG